MVIRADLHVHSIASYDGSATPEQLAAQAKRLGLDALAVADHDLCTQPPENGEVLFIPAAELSTDGGHLLALFLKTPLPETLLRGYPPMHACVQEIHRCGGVAVLAHPFAPQKLEDGQLLTLLPDAIETVNARAALHAGANERAAELARQTKLPQTGGSDAHSLRELANACTEFDVPQCSLDALRQALLDGRCRAVLTRPCRWRDKGRSQLRKCRGGTLRQKLRALLYALACVFRDFLHV